MTIFYYGIQEDIENIPAYNIDLVSEDGDYMTSMAYGV